MNRYMTIGLIGVGLLVATSCHPDDRQPAAGGEGAEQQHNPHAANAGCYVCHMTFVKEPLSVTHLKAKVSCARCHGPSLAHANDEDIGATKPDKVFKHEQVPAFCRGCHKLPENHPEKIILGIVKRKKPEPGTVCTDCHGKHKIGPA